VIESRHPKFAVGEQVVGYLGWQEYGLSDGSQLMKVDSRQIPLSAYLGPVGMPGVTAWVGLNRIIEPKAGETIVVSAAAGAVGSVVGQLAKLGNCRAVGIAGGEEKCRYVVEELGFDACIDYKREDVGKALKAAAPDGIDGYFENVGGEIMDALLPRMNAFGRIAVCGLIAGYNGEPIPIRNPTWFLGEPAEAAGLHRFRIHAAVAAGAGRTRRACGRRPDQVPRKHRARARERAGGIHRSAQGAELRQATGAVVERPACSAGKIRVRAAARRGTRRGLRGPIRAEPLRSPGEVRSSREAGETSR